MKKAEMVELLTERCIPANMSMTNAELEVLMSEHGVDEEIDVLVADALAEFADMAVEQEQESSEVAVSRETPAQESNEVALQRANRLAISKAGDEEQVSWIGRFYRTHKLVGTIEIPYIDGLVENTEGARIYAIDRSEAVGVEWKPQIQQQSWERKYNKYENDEQVAEDATSLIASELDKFADKCKFGGTIADIAMTSIDAKASNLGYIEDGKYTKSGCWASADIEMTITYTTNCEEVGQTTIDIIYCMEVVSGQIKKPKLTITKWNGMVEDELKLEGYIADQEEDAE